MYKQGNEEASQAVVKASDANTMFTEMVHGWSVGRDGGGGYPDTCTYIFIK